MKNKFSLTLPYLQNLFLTTYLVLGFFVMITAPILATRWLSPPFIGGFLDAKQHVIRIVNNLPDATWVFEEHGLTFQDQVVAINGIRFTSSQSLSRVLSNFDLGDTVSLTILSEKNQPQTISIPLSHLSRANQILLILVPLGTALICFFCGIWVFQAQSDHKANQAIMVLSTSLAIISGTFFDFITTQRLVPLFIMAVGISAGSLFQAAMVFPRNHPLTKKRGWLPYAAYPHNLILIGIVLIHFYTNTENALHLYSLRILILSNLLSGFILTINIVNRLIKSKSPFIKIESIIMTIATLVVLLPLLVQLSNLILQEDAFSVNPLVLISFCVFPITAVFILQRFKLPQTSRILKQTLIYILVTLTFGAIYTLVIILLNVILIKPVSPGNPWLLGGVIILIIFIFDPIRKALQSYFIELYFKQPVSIQNKALDYAAALTAISEKREVVALYHRVIKETLTPNSIILFLFNPETKSYQSVNPDQNAHKKTIEVDSGSALAATIEKINSPLYFDQNLTIPKSLNENRDTILEIGAILYLPLPANQGILGWVALGPKKNENRYTTRDLNLLESFSNQFSIAYQRVDAMQRTRENLRENEILNRILVAINTTDAFDELLQTVYFEVKNVIPIVKLSLLLKTEGAFGYQRQFLMDDDMVIISTRNPQPVPENFIEKHALEMQQIHINNENGWLSIPLTMNNNVIGAISLRGKNNGSTFDQTRLNMLSSIANLITGAIIKAQLLQTSREQTQQLRTLNRISNQLSSTLALEPLLNSILENALLILACDAGSLLIADTKAQEFIFEVTAGPVADSLRGTRMPIDKGFAGQSFASKESIIINNVKKSQHWFKKTDQDTGYNTRSMITVPLIARGRAIGVLEVINKTSGLPFNPDDQQLLEAFANQAAIAIENARLYLKTDQALESRVEELSTMQNIDRELNSSRDIDLALRLTLKSAIGQTNARMGTIFLVKPSSEICLAVWQKQMSEEKIKDIDKMPCDILPNLPKGHQQNHQFIHSQKLCQALKIDSNYQHHLLILIPLEEDLLTFILLHLTSPDTLSEDDLAFLTRLADHAAVALTSAVLYKNLHEVINAKNEFINFISHELKNPLTAIKGYADLLAEGFAGNITAKQSEFLKTIKNNTNRMNTFITDLADQARIETQSLRLVFSATSICEVIDEVLHNYNHQIQEKAIHIEQHYASDLPDVWCDRLRLIQILSNLISNAIKYSHSGGEIEINAEVSENRWDENGSAEVVHFWIKDNGFGISVTDENHIFEKFYRGSDDKIRSIPGSGLGLIISKNLVEMMGGKIWFESYPGKGSTFHFTLPF